MRTATRSTGLVALVAALLAIFAASLVVVLAATGLAAAPAGAAIKIYRTNDQATLLGKIKKGECRVRGKKGDRYFRATGKSTNRRYQLSLTILYWRGYKRDYDFRYGDNNPGVFYLGGPGGPFSNILADKAPGIPAGGVAFSKRGSRMTVGFLPAPNSSGRRGVVLAGSIRC